ncbi:MAG TPA: NlpC/P60 family protein [Thermoleophilia bacterium]|nr:NlpC/P60 family protein [Thermoleophilia bacterium]
MRSIDQHTNGWPRGPIAKKPSRLLDSLAGTSVARLALVRETLRQLGIPYVWGGASRHGFDCSGLVLYVYRQFGVPLYHGATMQAHQGSPAYGQLLPGDLVFFGGPGYYHHVGIYIGDGHFVEAPHTGAVVRTRQLSGSGYATARRYPVRNSANHNPWWLYP